MRKTQATRAWQAGISGSFYLCGSMVSKADKKYIRSLQRKKFRHQYNAFVCEGTKIVKELIVEKAHVQQILATEEWQQEQKALLEQTNCPVQAIEAEELKKLSFLATPSQVMAVVKKPAQQEPLAPKEGNLTLALEDISDPGNLGTIIRTADWFGIETIYSSYSTVDAYNPKVIQSTMGSFLRVNVLPCDLTDILAQSTAPVLAACMDGQNLFEVQQPGAGAVLLIGNESHGLSHELLELAHHKVSIPSWGSAESLNAAVASAIIMAWARMER